MWDCGTGALRNSWVFSVIAGRSPGWLGDRPTVWSSSIDRTARCWSLEDLRNPDVAMNHHSSVRAFVAPDHQRIASGSRDHSIKMAGQNGEAVHEMHGHTGAAYDLDISESAPLLASASTDETVRLWSTETGKSIPCCGGCTGHLLLILNHTTDQRWTRHLRVWNLNPWNPVGLQRHENCSLLRRPLGWSSYTVRQL